MGAIVPLGRFGGAGAQKKAEYLNGFYLAAGEINKESPDIKLSFLMADADENNLPAQFDAMKKSGVKIFHIGSTNAVAQNLNFLERQNQGSILINFLCEYAPAVVRVKNSVRLRPNTATICEKMASIIPRAQNRGGSIIILSSNDFFGKSAAAYMKYQTGSEGYAIRHVEYKTGDFRFDALADAAIQTEPKFLIFYGEDEALAPLLKSLKNKNFGGAVISNAEPGESALKNAEGLSLYYIKRSLKRTEKNAEFFDKYQKLHKRPPSPEAAEAYDSAKLLFYAYKKSGFDAKAARESLLNSRQSLAEGVVRIDSCGDSESALSLEKAD